MLISDWSSDVCSSDLVSFEREHPSLDRPCAVFAPRAVPLRLQDAPAGARLGHDGLGRPLQEISDAGDAQAAIPVPDDQSDPDRERAFRLFGDRASTMPPDAGRAYPAGGEDMGYLEIGRAHV